MASNTTVNADAVPVAAAAELIPIPYQETPQQITCEVTDGIVRAVIPFDPTLRRRAIWPLGIRFAPLMVFASIGPPISVALVGWTDHRAHFFKVLLLNACFVFCISFMMILTTGWVMSRLLCTTVIEMDDKDLTLIRHRNGTRKSWPKSKVRKVEARCQEAP